MNRIYISLRDIPTTRLQLGFEGENDHTQVIFDWTLLYARYPSAVASMTVKSPSGGLYPKELVQTSNKLLWNVSASDCAKAGSGQYQLTFTNDTEVIKTFIGSFSVNSSLIGSGDPPDPVEDWLQEAQEALNAFEQDVTDAEAWAVGTRDGEPVGSTDPAYENNSKYYAEQAEEVLESIPSDYTELSEDVDSLHAIKAPAIISSASGAIVSFPDGADNMPVKTLTVGVEPVQDLHGQDSPYPAGGGVNKLLPSDIDRSNTVQSVTATWAADSEELTLNGANSGSYAVVIDFRAENGHIKFPDLQVGDTWSVAADLPTGSYLGVVYKNTSNTEVQFWYISGDDTFKKDTRTVPDDFVSFQRVQIGINPSATFSNAKCHIAFVGGSTITAWTPYSNICPISGWTGANVTRTGKNLVDVNSEDNINAYVHFQSGIENNNLWSTSYYIPVKSGIPYILSGLTSHPNSNTDNFIQYDKNKNQISIKSVAVSNYPLSFDAGTAFVRFCWKKEEKDTVMFEESSVATAYEPYQGETIEYEFPSSAGTVYGGTLTIHQDGSGELVVDHANMDLGTITSWTKITTSGSHWRFYAYLNTAVPGAKLYCSDYKWITASEQYLGEQGVATQSSGSNVLVMVSDEAYSDTAEFKTAMSGVYLVYKLATPVTYQLTNQQVVSLLKGNNNLWADTGNVAVEYPADTKLFIEKKISELQALILENISNS